MTTKNHSDQFVEEMKKKLIEELAELNKKINTITGVTGEAQFPEYGRNDEDNATEIADHAATASTEDVLEKRLEAVEGALDRVSKNIYGITSDGELIPEERLRANPAATTLVTAT